MNVKEMIVTTRYGADCVWFVKKGEKPDETPELVEKSAAGDIHYVKEVNRGNHFQFYARESLSPKTEAVIKTESITQEGSSDTISNNYIEYKIGNDHYSDYVREVQIIMPLGGDNSGIFRQPKVGEKVLVLVSDDNRHYLQGFIPETDEDFSTENENGGIEKTSGQVLRYRHTGDNYTEYPCSEIGFYTKTHYRTERKKSNKFGKTESFDMNEINIVSTGDIKNFASERYSIAADKLILGIGGGDNPNTSISIDELGNINIEAKNSINFKVGRTSVSISEEGFVVSSKLTDTPVSNTYDASIALRPMEGFIASGMNCTLNAVKTASIGDSMGGNFSASTGVTNIRGRDIKLSNYNKTEFAWLTINSIFSYFTNFMSLCEGSHFRNTGGDDGRIAAERLQLFIKWMTFTKGCIQDGFEIYDAYQQIKEVKEKLKAQEKEIADLEKKLHDAAEERRKAEDAADNKKAEDEQKFQQLTADLNQEFNKRLAEGLNEQDINSRAAVKINANWRAMPEPKENYGTYYANNYQAVYNDIRQAEINTIKTEFTTENQARFDERASLQNSINQSDPKTVATWADYKNEITKLQGDIINVRQNYARELADWNNEWKSYCAVGSGLKWLAKKNP